MEQVPTGMAPRTSAPNRESATSTLFGAAPFASVCPMWGTTSEPAPREFRSSDTAVFQPTRTCAPLAQARPAHMALYEYQKKQCMKGTEEWSSFEEGVPRQICFASAFDGDDWARTILVNCFFVFFIHGITDAFLSFTEAFHCPSSARGTRRNAKGGKLNLCLWISFWPKPYSSFARIKKLGDDHLGKQIKSQASVSFASVETKCLTETMTYLASQSFELYVFGHSFSFFSVKPRNLYHTNFQAFLPLATVSLLAFMTLYHEI